VFHDCLLEKVVIAYAECWGAVDCTLECYVCALAVVLRGFAILRRYTRLRYRCSSGAKCARARIHQRLLVWGLRCVKDELR